MSIALGKSVGRGWAKVSKFLGVGKYSKKAIEGANKVNFFAKHNLQKVMAEYKEGAVKCVDKDLQPNITRLKNGGYKIQYDAGIVMCGGTPCYAKKTISDTIICDKHGKFQNLICRASLKGDTARERKSYTVFADLQRERKIKSVDFSEGYFNGYYGKKFDVYYPGGIKLKYHYGSTKKIMNVDCYQYNGYIDTRLERVMFNLADKNANNAGFNISKYKGYS